VIRAPSPSDRHELCDWAELTAAVSNRHSVTLGDLIKVIQPDDSRVDNPNADEDESTEDEMIAEDVLSVALGRSKLLGKAYPFAVYGQVLRFDSERAKTTGQSYLFHLLFAAAEPPAITSIARHQFEVESRAALTNHFGGESFHFGWTKLNADLGKIQSRVEELCSQTNLGWKARNPVNVSVENNDVGVDILVWRQFPDSRPNTMVMVGQCASGHDWRGKLATSATRLLEDCLSETRDGPWVNVFATPFHIPDRIWRESARAHDGVLFDRMRLVWATGAADIRAYGRLVGKESRDWVTGTLKSGGKGRSPDRSVAKRDSSKVRAAGRKRAKSKARPTKKRKRS
jgi:hypothetical protein